MLVHVMKNPQGAFVPATEEDIELMRKFKVGEVQRVEITQMRNGKLFRKFFVLAKFAFDMWSDRLPEQEWNGVKVLANFDRFRKDLIILAGFFKPVWNAKGEVRVEADSISWANMSDEKFEKLYSKSIDVILAKIIPNAGLDEKKLRDTVDQLLLGFA